MKEFETTSGKAYAVSSAAGTTVTSGNTLVEVEAGKQAIVIAQTNTIQTSSDDAIITEL